MPSSTVTAKGQTTIPKEIRDHLKLRPGNRIDYIVDRDGRVVLEPATYDIRELHGLLHRAGGKALTVEQMNRVIQSRHGSKR
jgi:AbrB family looped-hinge helix DNA binding protein